MAKVDFKMPGDFLQKISRLEERTDDIIPKVLDKVRGNLQAVVGSGTKHPSRSTGELVSALGLLLQFYLNKNNKRRNIIRFTAVLPRHV